LNQPQRNTLLTQSRHYALGIFRPHATPNVITTALPTGSATLAKASHGVTMTGIDFGES